MLTRSGNSSTPPHPRRFLVVGVNLRPLVVLDGDDTLWLVEHLYDEAREAAAEVVAEGLDGLAWDELERRIDVQNVVRFGVRAGRFPKSCVEAYVQIASESGGTPMPAVAERVRAAASSVYSRRATPVEDVDVVLGTLRPECTLVLLTKGEEWVQRKRITEAGLANSFEYIAITSTKDGVQFLELLTRFEADPRDSWSVGNSLASDINPALRLDMNGIWIEAHVWEHERRETTPAEGRLFIVEELSAVPGIILDNS